MRQFLLWNGYLPRWQRDAAPVPFHGDSNICEKKKDFIDKQKDLSDLPTGLFCYYTVKLRLFGSFCVCFVVFGNEIFKCLLLEILWDICP